MDGDYHAITADKVVSTLGSSTETGLSVSAVKQRQEKFGLNVLAKQKKMQAVKILAAQFTDIMVIILIIASIISFAIGMYDANELLHSEDPLIQQILSYKSQGLSEQKIERELLQQGYTHAEIFSLLEETRPSEIIDGIVILIIVLINAVVGFFQEFKAEKSLEALKKMIDPQCKVLRDGKEQEINVADLVPGDILLLEEGSKISADARLLDVAEFKTDESALTGESVPVSKHTDQLKNAHVAINDRKNMVFMGTIVSHGRATAIVTATGMTTEFGKIAQATKDIKDDTTPLQDELNAVGSFTAKFTVIICLLVFGIGVLQGNQLFQMFLFAISLAVAAVPEGLPATVTIALALGVMRMVKKNSVIRRLASVETLGSTTVICSDKTGTLTKNEMTVKEIYYDGKTIEVDGLGYVPKGTISIEKKQISAMMLKRMQTFFSIGALCNDASLVSEKKAWKMIGDPTEGALVVLSEKAGLSQKSLEKQQPRIFEIPFDSERKTMITVHKLGAKKMLYAKGAFSELISGCSHYEANGRKQPMTAAVKKKLLEQNDAMAKKALRVLAFAYKDVSKESFAKGKKHSADKLQSGMVFSGLVGMIDPPREDVKDAVAVCKKAGIKIVVITGDHAVTAKAIAVRLGIVPETCTLITGEELDKTSDEKLKRLLKQDVLFARVSPEHKLRIVTILQEQGHRVAVTGDGVNDAPALKKADIGVAMGISGTDVSKEASDMVLMDDSFSTIVAAVGEGRSIYANIKKFMKYMFSSNLGELFAVFISLFLLPHKLILSATQILWINLGTDLFPALSLGVEPPEADIMEQKPRDPKERIIKMKSFLNWVATGLVMAGLVLGIYFLNLPNEAKAGTMAFTVLVIAQMFNVFNCRSQDKSVFKMHFFSNKWLLLSIVSSVLLQAAVIYIPFLRAVFNTTPLGIVDWLVILGFSSMMLVYDEARKYIVSLKIPQKNKQWLMCFVIIL